MSTKTAPITEVSAAGEGKRRSHHWDCRTRVDALAARTSLHISREGMFAAWRDKLGARDVHVGDVSFDSGFCLRGSDEDVVRAVCQRVVVQDAIRHLFADPDVRDANRHSDGRLVVWARRRDTTASAARDKALAVSALARALELVADAPPVPAADSPLRIGVGSVSGTPVGISVIDRDA